MDKLIGHAIEKDYKALKLFTDETDRLEIILV